jgi:hypothetical protein
MEGKFLGIGVGARYAGPTIQVDKVTSSQESLKVFTGTTVIESKQKDEIGM